MTPNGCSCCCHWHRSSLQTLRDSRKEHDSDSPTKQSKYWHHTQLSIARTTTKHLRIGPQACHAQPTTTTSHDRHFCGGTEAWGCASGTSQEMTPSTSKNKNMFNVSNIDWVCEPSVCAPMKQHPTSRITWCRDGVPVHPAVALSKLSGKYMSTRRTPKRIIIQSTAPSAVRIPKSHQLPTSTHPVQSRSPRNTASLGRVRLPHKYTNEVSFATVSALCIACCLSSGYTQKTYDFHKIRPLSYQSIFYLTDQKRRFASGHENQEYTLCRTLTY